MPVRPGVLLIPEQRVTSPGLRAERMLSREIGYLGMFDNGALLDVRLFSDDLSDGIFANKITSSFTNGMSTRYRGLESTLKYTFGKADDLTVNFSHARGSSNGPTLFAAGQGIFRSVSPWTADVYEASIPRNSGSVLYAHRFADDVSFSAAYYRQDALQPFDRGDIDYQPAQNRTDVRVAKTFRQVAGLSGDIALVVQNLFNQKYSEYIASNVFNQRAYVTLNLKWR